MTWTTSAWSNVSYKLYRYFDEYCFSNNEGVDTSLVYSGTALTYTDTTIGVGHAGCYFYYFVKAIANVDQQSSTSNTVQYEYDIFLKPGEKESDETTSLPLEYKLKQNYPNPFNPQVTIQYSLPEPQYVKLIVCDMLGQTVATLVDEMQEAGYRSVNFDGSNLPSAVYFYRLQAGKFVDQKKMILLR